VPIVRRLLRDDVRAEIMRKVFAGDFVPGAKINEIELAAELAVSRTPVREALALLSQEGVLESVPGRGFVLPPITVTEVREIYPLIAALEALALRNSHPTEVARLVPELEDVCLRMLSAGSSTHAQQLDEEWHTTLCGLYENHTLHVTIAGFKRRVNRYELTLFADEHSVRESVREHRAIAEALAKADIDGAVARLEVNWKTGMQRLLRSITDERDR
jgi:DNA-binding GntR family transcriptional regulator